MKIASSLKRCAAVGLGLAVAVCFAAVAQPATALAAPSKATVSAAYAKYVPAHVPQGAVGGYNVKYADIDGNGVKECLVNTGYDGNQIVYTYKKGKVRKLTGGYVARGGTMYYSTKKHIVTISYAGFAYDGVDVYKIRKGKATKIANVERLHRTNEATLNGTACTMEKANAVVTKYSSGYKKVKSVSMNTSVSHFQNGYYQFTAGYATATLGKTKITVNGPLDYGKSRSSMDTLAQGSSVKHAFKFSSSCKYYRFNRMTMKDEPVSKSAARQYLAGWNGYYYGAGCTLYMKKNVVTKVYIFA